MDIEAGRSRSIGESQLGWWLRGVVSCALLVVLPVLIYAFTVGTGLDIRFPGYLALMLGLGIVFLGAVAYPLLALAFGRWAPAEFKSSAIVGVFSLPVLTVPVILLLASMG